MDPTETNNALAAARAVVADMKKSGNIISPNDSVVHSITPENVAKSLADGIYEEIQRKHAANYDALISAALKAGYPQQGIRVAINKLDENNIQSVSMVATSPTTAVVIINEAALEMTAAYFQERKQLSNQKLMQLLANGELHRGEEAVAPEVLNHYERSAEVRKLGAPPKLYLRPDDKIEPVIKVAQTQEGQPFIVFNKAFLRLKPDQQMAVLDHELAHHQLGHGRPEFQALVHNVMRITGDMRHVQILEALTDRVGVCSAYDPPKSSRHLADALAELSNITIDFKIKPDMKDSSKQELIAEADRRYPSHPPIVKRVTDVLSYPSSCPVKPLETPSDPSRESAGAERKK